MCVCRLCNSLFYSEGADAENKQLDRKYFFTGVYFAHCALHLDENVRRNRISHLLHLLLRDIYLCDDVAPGKWYAQSIAYCVEHGIMQGDGNGKFRPDEPITRAEVAAVAERLHKMLA